MEEFIFGTHASDELKLVHHRTAYRGLQHAQMLAPRDPLPGQPVTLTVRAGPDLTAAHVAVIYTTDGTEPAGSRGLATNGQVLPLQRVSVDWDSLIWGYYEAWQGTLPGQPDGTLVRYQVGAWLDGGPETWADWPDRLAAAEQAAHAFFRGLPLPAEPPGDPGRGYTFAYSVDHHTAPAWAREAVIYHVFVDRFYPGRGRGWTQTDDLLGFCGGTLWGLAEKLDYVSDLGATCIWLSPIFPSPTHHGYDATDVFHVEPRLGGDDALRAVVREAHSRGIRVLLDFVCNHVSDQHPVFQEALRDPGSRYRQWFVFDDSEAGYRTYFGVKTMPEINVANPQARAWLIDAARYWLREFEVDGYRLDHADGPGPDFWTDFWRACKAEKADCFCFGEVVDAPAAQLAFVGRLDGILDHNGADALRRTFATGRWSEQHLARFLEQHTGFFPAGWLMPTFVDNHDIDRFLFLAGGDKDALRRAAAVQMRLPGPPVIYYGTEVGLSQGVSIQEGHGMHVNRVPMVWGEEQDSELLAFYRQLIAGRKRQAG